MTFHQRRRAPLAAIALVLSCALALSGCFGMYNNSKRFIPGPQRGDTELDMLKTYGAPDFVGFVENQKIYIYKVRENYYIIAVGLFAGYDLVVTTENGKVREIKQVERPMTLTVLQPNPWSDVH